MYNGNVGGVSGGGNVQWSKSLADKLDEADGNKDGKISASVWNNFMKSSGSSGNSISNYITISNAERSLNFYAKKKDAGKVDWNNWETMANDFKENVPVKLDTTPVNVSKTTTLPPALKPDEMKAADSIPKYPADKTKAGQTVQGDGGKYYRYDTNGNVTAVYNSKEDADDDNASMDIFYNSSGELDGFAKTAYENGEEKSRINYKADGSYDGSYTRELDNAGKVVGFTSYDSDGKVDRHSLKQHTSDGSTVSADYDDKGNLRATTKRLKSGVTMYYDNDGKFTKAKKQFDANGHYYTGYEYNWDSKGNLEK